MKHLGKKSPLTAAQIRKPRRILDVFPNPRPGRPYEITLAFPEFTSVCPVTGQPDFATIEVTYTPAEVCVEMKSLKLYYWAYRDQGAFFEDVVNRIADDLASVLKPVRLVVVGKFNTRGGMSAVVRVEIPTPSGGCCGCQD